MDVTRIVLAPLVLLAGLLAIGWPNYYEALQRSKQQRTMAGMRDLAIRIEARQPYTITDDGWGHPMRVHVAGKHYAIRAASADGRFERTSIMKVTQIKDFDADVVLVDGNFLQFPEGICGGDVAGKGPLAECMSCHPHRIQKR